MNSEERAIRADAKALVTKIREYCRIQDVFWKSIPSLALSADGRTGWSDQLGRAYYHKLWALKGCGTDANGYMACIDLQNGEIVSTLDTSKLADDRHVLALAWDLAEINAERLTNDLKAEARTPRSKHVGKRSPGEYDEIIKNLRRERPRGPVPLQFG